MKKIILLLIFLICLINISSCKLKKNKAQQEDTQEFKLLKPFFGMWNGKDEDSTFVLNITKSDEKHITVELFESGEQNYNYLCTIDELTKDTLRLNYEKLVLNFKILNGELTYSKMINGNEAIEGTSKPMRFDK